MRTFKTALCYSSTFASHALQLPRQLTNMNAAFASHSPASAHAAQPAFSSAHGSGGSPLSTATGSWPSSASTARSCASVRLKSWSARLAAMWRGFVERKDLDYWDQYADFY